jgi:hypothetical protein
VLSAVKGAVHAVERAVAALHDPTPLRAEVTLLRAIAPRLRQLELQLVAVHARQGDNDVAAPPLPRARAALR